ncbi:MAG: hypothetical protein VX248_11035 [Pseudomonadota bacterium]|nr:hypothetical protein [Pseudomonadota bacterium]
MVFRETSTINPLALISLNGPLILDDLYESIFKIAADHSMPDFLNFTIIDVLALCVACESMRRSIKNSTEIQALNASLKRVSEGQIAQQNEQIRKSKIANISVVLLGQPDDRTILCIKNSGPHAARGLDLQTEGDQSFFNTKEKREIFPLKNPLEAGEKITLQSDNYPDREICEEIVITWLDASSDKVKRKSFTLLQRDVQ